MSWSLRSRNSTKAAVPVSEVRVMAAATNGNKRRFLEAGDRWLAIMVWQYGALGCSPCGVLVSQSPATPHHNHQSPQPITKVDKQCYPSPSPCTRHREGQIRASFLGRSLEYFLEHVAPSCHRSQVVRRTERRQTKRQTEINRKGTAERDARPDHYHLRVHVPGPRCGSFLPSPASCCVLGGGHVTCVCCICPARCTLHTCTRRPWQQSAYMPDTLPRSFTVPCCGR